LEATLELPLPLTVSELEAQNLVGGIGGAVDLRDFNYGFAV
jgi:hypothetical protein